MNTQNIFYTGVDLENLRIDGIGLINVDENAIKSLVESRNNVSGDDTSTDNGDPPKLVWDYTMMALGESQRISMGIIVIILLAHAVFGNCATIYVNLTRKRRPLFRVCLLSLALSDLLISVFTSIGYLSQFQTPLTVAWSLGAFLCGFIPFITTMAILTNSMTLVGIALDRYIAVKKLLKGACEPSLVFCLACAGLVWAVAGGISSPMISSYFIVPIIVVITDPRKNFTWTGELKECDLCKGEKQENSSYYGIVFGIVFVPLLIAFFVLNMTIAREIYNRRHPIEQQSNSSTSQTSTEDSTSDKRTSETNTMTSGSDSTKYGKITVVQPIPKPKPNPVRTQRKVRQLRMFIVIIVIISVFLILRLPTWIYLLIKMNMTLTENIHWVLHYTFGILSLLNCVVNPFLYTFLSETIIYGTKATRSLKNCCSSMLVCCDRVDDAEESGSRETTSNCVPVVIVGGSGGVANEVPGSRFN